MSGVRTRREQDGPPFSSADDRWAMSRFHFHRVFKTRVLLTREAAA